MALLSLTPRINEVSIPSVLSQTCLEAPLGTHSILGVMTSSTTELLWSFTPRVNEVCILSSTISYLEASSGTHSMLDTTASNPTKLLWSLTRVPEVSIHTVN